VTDGLAVLTARVDAHDDFRRTRSSQVKRQIAFIVVGGMLGLGLVAYRGEANDNEIRESRHQACLVRLASQTEFNNTREMVGRLIVALSPDAPAADKDAMLAGMIASKQLPLPTCTF
jgi:hypothetical protein